MDQIIRRTLENKGIDPDEAIAACKKQYDIEEEMIAEMRAKNASK